MIKSVGNLSLTEKVGQMFMIGLDGTIADEKVIELIQTYKIGGVILYKENIESAEQLLRLINSLKCINMGNEIPLFIAVAEEGGRASIIPKEIIKLPAIKYVADMADKELVKDIAKLNSKILRSFGINMNFWPVLDLGGAVNARPIGDRIISTNPVVVSSIAQDMVNVINSEGIIAVPKYFPGHATTKNKNSKIVIPSTNKSLQRLEAEDLAPFKTMIENGIDALLVGHINMSKLNLFAPATLSYKVITRLLKERYAFGGIAITDDLTAPAVDIQYGIKSSTRKAILAGADLIIIKDINKAKAVLEDIEKQIREGNIDTQEISLRVQKILQVKDKFELEDKEVTELEIKKLNEEIEQMITRIRSK